MVEVNKPKMVHILIEEYETGADTYFIIAVYTTNRGAAQALKDAKDGACSGLEDEGPHNFGPQDDFWCIACGSGWKIETVETKAFPMKRFKVSAAVARQRGALGVFEPVSEEVEAESMADAEKRFRAKWEAHGVMVEFWPLGSKETTT